MAKIIPFRAIRPARDKVALVVSRSYETYTKEEIKARLRFNPFTFLHVIRPGYKFRKKISGPERFNLVKNRYLEFMEEDVFIRDEEPCVYIYKMRENNETHLGIFAATDTPDYKNNVIKRHEDTMEAREELFKEYLKVVGFNAEPVLLTYPDNEHISEILQKAMLTAPEYEFTSTDKVTHWLWKLSGKNVIKKLQAEFEAIGPVYIADGHHRTASSYLLSEDMKTANETHTGTEPTIIL